MLTSKQRVLAALSSQQPDRVPIVETIDWPIRLKLAEILGLSIGSKNDPFKEMDLNCRLADALELDWVDSYHSTGQEAISNTHLKDKYGCVFMTSEHGCPVIVDGPIKDAKDLTGFDMTTILSSDDFDKERYMRIMI